MFHISYKAIVIAAIGIIGFIIAIKAISPEDTWLCQKGEWVQHGHPSSPPPVSLCK